jgi:hypothetical protein
MASHHRPRRSLDETSQSDRESNTCPECGGAVIDEAYERICIDCGLVVDEYRLDHAAKRVSFDEESDIQFSWNWRVRSTIPAGETEGEDLSEEIPKALLVDVVIGLQRGASQQTPYELVSRIIGTFAAIRPDDEWPDEYPGLHEFVGINAVTSLMPYLRHRVSDLSDQTPYPPYYIPMVNVPELMASFELKKSFGWEWLAEYQEVASAFGVPRDEFE